MNEPLIIIAKTNRDVINNVTCCAPEHRLFVNVESILRKTRNTVKVDTMKVVWRNERGRATMKAAINVSFVRLLLSDCPPQVTKILLVNEHWCCMQTPKLIITSSNTETIQFSPVLPLNLAK